MLQNILSTLLRPQGEESYVIQPTVLNETEFERLMNVYKGGINIGQGKFLRSLAASIDEGCIVEVGSYRGKSAIALAMGVRDRAAGKKTEIYCVEPHREFVGLYGGQFGPVDRKAFFEVMCHTGAFNDVALINLSSEQVASSWNKPVGMAFIDGDHRYIGVKRDFDQWDRHVLVGGLVVFDDAADVNGGPYRLINEIVAEGRYQRIDQYEKIVCLRKIEHRDYLSKPVPMRKQRILVACDEVLFAGGLFRFDRVGKVLQDWGHEVAFVALGNRAELRRQSNLPILTLEQASDTYWDCVMVPGAGFPQETIEKFAELQAPQFGVRVQHILNDQHYRDTYFNVNKTFKPQVLMFNNLHWPAGTYTEFQAERFHVLPGAVDTEVFAPKTYRSHWNNNQNWVIAGLASKNPDPLVAALRQLPENHVLRLFGTDHFELATKHSDLVQANRLQLVGSISEDKALSAFYHEVDCVAMTEEHAGWANIVAEAMASGVPVVCSAAGSLAMAKNEQTALVVDSVDSNLFANSIKRLAEDAQLCARLTTAAREGILEYSWHEYARKLLKAVSHDGQFHYIHLPELGMHGKWSIDERFDGLEAIIERAQGASVVDFGAAEGYVSRKFLENGAVSVDGFELNPGRVKAARALCADWPTAKFYTANLGDWNVFKAQFGDKLSSSYDIVLYLGLQQHLPTPARLTTIREAIKLAKKFFVIRTPVATYEADKIDDILNSEGFTMLNEARNLQATHLGTARIYERKNTSV